MAYSDFDLDDILADFGLAPRPGSLFAGVPQVEVPDWLPAYLTKAESLAFASEKSRSEAVVMPVLLALREVHAARPAVFSGLRLDADTARGLNGVCDFILALTDAVLPLKAPVVTLVEAKQGDIEQGIGQCVAQMLGAQLFNARFGEGDLPVYGCVTNADVWLFLRLDGTTLTQDRVRYSVSDLPKLLGVLAAIVSDVEAKRNPTPARPDA